MVPERCLPERCQARLASIPDLNWKFDAVGDYNRDGKNDIFLRHYGNGSNQVWYMNNVNRTGSAMLNRIPDINWRIVN